MSGFRRGMIANATASDPMLKVPLTFTAEEAGATVALNVYGTCTIPGMHYRMGVAGDWMPYTAGTVLTLANIGDSCQFWNSAETLAINAYNSNYAKFVIPKKMSASGNIMSLLNWREDCYDQCFFALFTGAKITKAPLLPATELATLCYDYMFSYCALIEPPKLPATVLAYGCYRSMLASCPALTKAPTLPAETSVDHCYNNMLNGCSNLTEIRVHFTSWSDATYQWVYGVTSTGTFYKPSALPEEYGESRIPEGWTVVNID